MKDVFLGVLKKDQIHLNDSHLRGKVQASLVTSPQSLVVRLGRIRIGTPSSWLLLATTVSWVVSVSRPVLDGGNRKTGPQTISCQPNSGRTYVVHHKEQRHRMAIVMVKDR